MKIIRAPALARAHELVIAQILEKGRRRRTENGEETLEIDEVSLRVETPLNEPMASAKSRFGRSFLDCYADSLISGSDASLSMIIIPGSSTGGRGSGIREQRCISTRWPT